MNNSQISHFPNESLADLGGVADWADQTLERLGERPLHPADPHQALVVRMLCLPSDSHACSIRAEAYGQSWRLFCRKLGSDESGFDSGELFRRDERLIVGDDAKRLTDLWEYLRFWSMSPDEEKDVFDGTTYVLEAAERGRYRVIHRDEPQWGDAFGEFSEVLLDLAGLAPR
jgi:hypothetical protein